MSSVGIVSAKAESRLSEDCPKEDIVGRSVRGAMVTIAAQVCATGIRTLSTVVLARLLLPRDYGLVAMVTAVTGFIEMFRELGLSSATIQSERLTHDQVSALFWINSLAGVCFASLLLLLGPGLAWFYREPRLTYICAALGISFIFSGLAAQPMALLKRKMRFSALGLIEVGATASGVCAAIWIAYVGGGYWAIVSMQVVVAVGVAVGAWLAVGWRPKLVLRTAGLGKLVRFGANLSGFNVLNYFARKSDNILVGRFWGTHSLGLYSKAYDLLLLPLQLVNYPTAQVAIPALSRLRSDDDRYRDYYYNATNAVAFMSFPVIAILLGAPREIIAILLGSRWLEMTPIFAVLAVAAFPQQILSTTGWIYISRGQADRMFRFAMITIPALVAAFVVGLKWGPLGVAFAYTIWVYALFVPGMLYAIHDSPLRFAGIWKALEVPAVMGLLVYFGMSLARQFVAAGSVFPSTLLIVSSGLALCAAGVAVWPRGRAEISRIYGFIRSFKLREKQ